MRTFYDPGALGKFSTIAGGLGDVLNVVGGFKEADETEDAAGSRAAVLRAKAEQEKKVSRRQQADLNRREELTMARIRAVLAANTGDLSDANVQSFLQQQAGEFAVEGLRLAEDAATTINSLLTEAQNELIFGKAKASSQRTTAITKAGKALTLIKGFPKTRKEPSTDSPSNPRGFSTTSPAAGARGARS